MDAVTGWIDSPEGMALHVKTVLVTEFLSKYGYQYH